MSSLIARSRLTRFAAGSRSASAGRRR
jgi:hypothetical protein